jgi:integrase
MKELVRISEVTSHPKCSHRVLFPGEDGKRQAKFFTNETDAMAFAEKKRRELGVNGSAFGTISNGERSALDCWRAFVTDHKDAPDLLVVIRDYVKEWKGRNASITITTALDRYLRHIEAEGASDRHVKSVESRIGRLVEDHGDKLVASIDEGIFSDWLNGLRGTRADKRGDKLSLTTRDNLKRTIRTFYGYCIGRGWASVNPVPLASRKKTKAHRVAKNKAPAIMLPEEVAKFLHKVEEVAAPVLPFWLVKFFAGIRDAEASRLDWSMIDMDKGVIRIPATASKTGDARNVTILPTLADWLRPYAQKSGPLAATDAKRRYYYKKAMRHLTKPEKKGGKKRPFTFPSNAARHSFGTYHLFHFRNAGETALQLGHKSNPAMLWEHYANPSAEEHAEAFWAIQSGKEKIVSISKGRRTA